MVPFGFRLVEEADGEAKRVRHEAEHDAHPDVHGHFPVIAIGA